MPKESLQAINKNEGLFFLITFLLLIGSLFVNLGIHPLYLEEPRRAIIALEMLFNKNLIIPTEFGEYYYKKPPFYNWFILIAFKVFGNYSEFAARFFSVCAFLGMGWSMFWMGKRYVGARFGIYSGLLFLVSIDLYYYFSTLGEIDIFYSFLTLLSFFSMFHFFEQKKYSLLFISTYFFAALGVLTKGLPSFVFLGISLPVFFWYNRQFKLLFSYHHALGILTLIVVAGTYFLIYSNYNGLEGYVRDLWGQSKERTLLEKSVAIKRTLFEHLYLFPLECLKNIFPFTLFLIFVIRKDFRQSIKGNNLIAFCIWMFLSNIIIYWISPGTRARYVYMLYPLLMMPLLYFYFINKKEGLKRILEVIIGVLIVLCFIGCVGLSFLPLFKKVSGLIYISIASSLFAAAILFFYFRFRSLRLLSLVLLMVLLRYVFNFTVLPLRAGPEQQAQVEKIEAAEISKIVNKDPLHIYYGINISHTSIFYIERGLEKVVGYKGKNFTDYFIASEQQLQNERYQLFYEFNSAKEKRLLIKFLK